MRRPLFLAVSMVSLLLLGCDDRLPPVGDDGGTAPDRGVDASQPRPDVGLIIKDLGPQPPECTIGIRVDNCCTNAQAVFTHEMELDPCLVPYPPAVPYPAECSAQWDPGCDEVDCIFGPPESRLVELNAVFGECQFVDECELPDDCILARDFRHCCSCFEAYPRALVERDRCLITPPQSAVPEECFNPECAAIDCVACPGIPAGVDCLASDGGFNRCSPSTMP